MKQPITATTIYNTALYCRLSKDDGLEQDSSSIQTQREMLTRYCKDNGFVIKGIYVDDGFSGTNMNRPEFQRMIADIEDGKINCVITKDLSRLGRNYLETGSYTEIYFPEHGVRYIAVNDNVDTLYSSTMDITPFRNLLNDMYAQDVSKKVKSAIHSRQKQGKYTGNKAPYGYKKDPSDKNHLIVDERYAPVVRRIFELAKDGMGVTAISRLLREEKVIRPAAIAAEENQSFCQYTDDNKKYEWTNSAVRCILYNPVYAGNISVLRRPTISLKSNKRANNGLLGEEIVENCHEPIVSQEDWNLVHRLIEGRHKTLADGAERYENIFGGLLKCSGCGKAITAHVNRRRKREFLIDQVTYQCSNYRIRGLEVCTQHFIEARELYDNVLADIRRVADEAAKNDEKFYESICKKLRSDEKDKAAQDEKNLRKYTRRLAELDKLFAKLYEDNVNGKVSDRNFATLSASYETEQNELDEKIATINSAIRENKKNDLNAEFFTKLIKEYAGITELTSAILNTLIDRIIVNEAEEVNGEVIQKVDVYYKFVGLLD